MSQASETVAEQSSTTRQYYEAACVMLILLMITGIATSFPAAQEYYYGADEGYYLKYATTLKSEGFFDGMRQLAENHAAREDKYIWPSPLRVFHLFQAMLFVSIFGGITGLSWMSLLSYAVLVFISFRFVRSKYGELSALIFSILLVTAPLGLGLSRRALMDSTTYLWVVATALVFLRYLDTPNRKWLGLFIMFHILMVLEKDPNILFLPGYALVWLYFFIRNRAKYKFIHGIIAAVAIPAVVYCCYAVLLGPDNFTTIYSALGKGAQLNEYTSYFFIYHQQPYYILMVDFTLLSPIMVIGGLIGGGYYFARQEMWKRDIPLLAFIFIINVLLLLFRAINVRHINYMEWLLLLMIAVTLPVILRDLLRNPKALVPAALTVASLIGVYNLVQFNRVFLVHKVYDPINHNLMNAAGALPKYELDTFSKKAPVITQSTPTAGVADLLNEGMQFYNEGNYEACIRANRRVLELDAKNSRAWNNICASHNQLKQYDKAIEACNKALELDASNQLARNNLAWAMSQHPNDGR